LAAERYKDYTPCLYFKIEMSEQLNNSDEQHKKGVEVPACSLSLGRYLEG
jgi:hypothetical protein